MYYTALELSKAHEGIQQTCIQACRYMYLIYTYVYYKQYVGLHTDMQVYLHNIFSLK